MTVDQLIDAWEAAWSGKDPDVFLGVCAPGVSYEDPLTGGPLHGVGELGRYASRLWAACPDARLERTGERLTNGHFVAAPSKLLATHRAPLDGLPATNKFIVMHCVFYCEIERELLFRVRGFFDVYGAATQLGILPAHGTLGEKALLVLRGFGLRAARKSA
jgi:steroid delta-isomerase-like uncharacterized protein